MEGEKERETERREEKESDEAEEDPGGAALVWQEGGGEDDLGLPIMHWEALSLRIAELEKQEEEQRERSKGSGGLDRDRRAVSRPDPRGGSWSDGGGESPSRVSALTSRQSQMNLQLCFINNSESEEEEEELAGSETSKMVAKRSFRKAKQPPAPAEKSKSGGGLRFEVRNALSALRDKLRTEQKKECHPDCNRQGAKRERSDFHTCGLKELTALSTSLSKDIQDLSSELVDLLLTRDQLRTEQDAMLLEVQDMTSL